MTESTAAAATINQEVVINNTLNSIIIATYMGIIMMDIWSLNPN